MDDAEAGGHSARPARPAGPRWHRAGKVDILLKKLPREVLAAECDRRGVSVSPAINAIITEWHLLQSIRRAEEFRRQMREDLLAAAAAAHLAVTSLGPSRAEALATLNAAIVQAERRLLLVMTI